MALVILPLEVRREYHCDTKAAWVAHVLNNLDADIQRVIERRVQRLERLGQVDVRPAVILAALAQHHVSLGHLTDNGLDYVACEGRIISVWDEARQVGFDIDLAGNLEDEG